MKRLVAILCVAVFCTATVIVAVTSTTLQRDAGNEESIHPSVDIFALNQEDREQLPAPPSQHAIQSGAKVARMINDLPFSVWQSISMDDKVDYCEYVVDTSGRKVRPSQLFTLLKIIDGDVCCGSKSIETMTSSALVLLDGNDDVYGVSEAIRAANRQ